MTPHTILLITRCSRIEFLKNIWSTIKAQAAKLENGNKFVWFIAFDTNRLSLAKIDRKFIEYLMYEQDIVKVHYMYSSSDNERYGSNIANAVLNHDVIIKRNDITHAYLLDDDNDLYPTFAGICNELPDDKLQFFSQVRLDKGPNTRQVIDITNELRADNAVQWVDSAQIIFPFQKLMECGGFADGYCIDGLTVKKMLEAGVEYETTNIIGAYYNYYTELLPFGITE